MQATIETLIRRRETLLDMRPPACLRRDGVSKERRRAWYKMMDEQVEKINAQIRALRGE
tara:strand:+ start:376 stop:552 length:177 start_codon:yes stop_codon:yes gene_type:complete